MKRTSLRSCLLRALRTLEVDTKQEGGEFSMDEIMSHIRTLPGDSPWRNNLRRSARTMERHGAICLNWQSGRLKSLRLTPAGRELSAEFAYENPYSEPVLYTNSLVKTNDRMPSCYRQNIFY